MRYVRHFLRLLRYAILAGLALAFGAILVLTLTERGRDNLAGLISDMASSPDQTVTINGLDGIWSGHLTLDSLVLGDGEGAWLVGRNVAIDWSPLALFSATFQAERIFAERIELARLPKAGSAKEDSGPFSLPVSLALKQIDLPDIAIGPELAGGVAAVALKGSLSADSAPLEIETDLNVARSDGRAGTIDASVHFVPDENRLDIDINGSEPQDGILANLLKLPGAPPVEIKVSGSGPLADWQGSGTLAVDGTVVTRLEGRHQLTDKGSVIAAKGDGEFQNFVPEMLRPLLSGKTVFDVAGTLTDAGGLAVERATLESNSMRGTAKGSIDPDGASDFALEVAATGEGVPLSFGTEESPIDMIVQSASLRALGAGNEPNLDITATLNKVSTNTAALDNLEVTLHSDAFNISARTGPVTGKATADALVIDNPTIAPLVAGQISAGFSGTLTTDTLIVEEGSLSSDALNGGFGGDVSLADGSINLDIEADVASNALPAAVRAALGERVKLTASFIRDTEGHVSVNPFDLSSGGFDASGVVRSIDGTIEAEIAGKIDDIAKLSENAEGAIDFALTADGALAAPEVSVTVTSDRIVAADREITGLKLTATGRADVENPAANVSLTGTVGGEPLQGNAVLSTSDGKREVRDLSLSLGENRITGDLVLDENFLPLGTVDFQLPDISPLAALALQTAEGDLSGTVTFSEQDGRPQLAVEAQTQALSRGDVTATDVNISATINDYVDAPAVTGKIRAKTVTSGSTVVQDVDVTLNQDGAWTGFDGGATVSDIPARASGRLKLADGKTTIELDSGLATVRGVPAKLARPSTVEIADGTTTLDKLALDIGGGTATISGTAGEALNLNATVSGVPASVANSFAPGLSAAGTISGTAKVTGQPSDPSVGFSVDWKGAQTAQTRAAGFGPMNLATSGDFTGGKLSFDSNIGDALGLGLKGGGSVDVTGRSLDLRFTGGVPFAFLTERLAAQGISLTGSANADIRVSGGLGAPDISGTVRTSGARLVAARAGIAINDISADVALGGGVATIRSLTGTLSTSGTISASGTVGIDPATGFPANLTVKIRDGRYTDGRVVTATMNGDLTVTGSIVASPTLAGTINLGRTVITVPDQLPNSLAELDVKHKNATAAVRAQEAALSPPAPSTGSSSDLILDVTVNANNQIFVQGRGLDAELGGNLKLTGSASAPQAVGRFTMTRGRVSILGKRLTFSRGNITFSGSLVPYLDLAADSSAGDTTVTVTVSGPANNPRFSFSSNPALPEEEVLARLIFGTSMSNLSPLQVVQLADAAAQLAGAGGSNSLLESLRSAVGIDDLDVRTTDDGGTAVTAGKYLNDRTYLSIEKGDKAGSGKATIDLKVGRGVKLRGQATDDGEAKAGIFFEREY